MINIAIEQSLHTGSEFFNYKHFCSAILLALVDVNYKFIYVDIETAGRVGDVSVFANSVLKTAVDKHYLDLPEASALQGMSA